MGFWLGAVFMVSADNDHENDDDDYYDSYWLFVEIERILIVWKTIIRLGRVN